MLKKNSTFKTEIYFTLHSTFYVQLKIKLNHHRQSTFLSRNPLDKMLREMSESLNFSFATCDYRTKYKNNKKYILYNYFRSTTIKDVYNDQTWDPKIVIIVDRWSLFRGHLRNKSLKQDFIIVFVIDTWSLFGGERKLRFH